VIHVFHGIHTASGSAVVPGLFPYLETINDVVYPDYGFILAVESRRINPVVAGSVRPYIGDGDILLGHSNGCAIIYELVLSGLLPRGMVLINAALRRDFQVPTGMEFVHVYFNAGDELTILAQAGAADGLVDPEWGDCGHAGYSGHDPRVRNFDCANTPGMPCVWGHSAIFEDENLEQWGRFIRDRIEDDCQPVADALNLRVCVP
jgi:hypothetical protein